MSAFISFLTLTRQDYTADEQIIIACPSQEQISVIITSLQLQPKTPKPSVSFSRSPSLEPSSAPGPISGAKQVDPNPESTSQTNGQATETVSAVEADKVSAAAPETAISVSEPVVDATDKVSA